MTKTPTLAAALETFERSPAPAPDTPDPVLVNRQPGKTRTGSTMQAPSRRGKKTLIGYFDPSVSKQLKQLALEEDSSVQSLLGEALDLLFQARGKPMIARVISPVNARLL